MPVTHVDLMLEKVTAAVQEYEADWCAGHQASMNAWRDKVRDVHARLLQRAADLDNVASATELRLAAEMVLRMLPLDERTVT
jgi:hypothetical protein